MFDVIELDSKLAQRFIVRINRLHAREVQQGIKQHGRVPIGEDKAVTIGPDGKFRIVAQKALPENVSYRRQRHGSSRMSGVGLLHRIHGECADGIDAELVKIAGVLEVFSVVGNVWQGYRKSHSLKHPLKISLN